MTPEQYAGIILNLSAIKWLLFALVLNSMADWFKR